MFSEQSSLVVPDHHLIYNKSIYYHLYWQKTLIYIIAVAEYGLSVVNIDLSKFMQQTHTKLYSSTALTLF